MEGMEWKNQLWFGDNLEVLRDKKAFPDEFVDLIYLDPPFNSNATYNMLFKEADGSRSEAQIEAFEDTWHWVTGQTDSLVRELKMDADYPELGNLIEAFEKFLGRNDLMAYLVMMAVRLKELHRVLKPTGSIYLHCDPTASHYIKLVLDAVFGFENYRNEIIWKRKTGRGETNQKSNKFGSQTDTIFFYSKSNKLFFNSQYNFDARGYKEYVDSFFKYTDENGRKYCIDNLSSPSPRPNLMYEYRGYKPPKNGWAISKELMEQWDKEGKLYFPEDVNGRIRRKRFADELKGRPVQNLWDDIEPISSQAQERLGYPTQKPEALLERIIKASSNEGDLVLDPFCGCGTTVTVAEKLKRRWIGIDITWLSVDLMERRLKDTFEQELSPYVVEGTPKDLSSAVNLAERDKYQFQWWAVTLIGARPYQGKKKGSDTGIDGIMFFEDKLDDKQHKIVVQVKAGKHVSSPHIRDLVGVLDREKAAIGVYISIEKPTKDMIDEARKAGVFESANGKLYPRIQMLTIEDIMAGKQPEYPYRDTGGFTPFKRAARKEKDRGPEKKLFEE